MEDTVLNWIALTRFKGVGPVTQHELLRRWKDPGPMVVSDLVLQEL